jgi:hypothetical protein
VYKLINKRIEREEIKEPKLESYKSIVRVTESFKMNERD